MNWPLCECGCDEPVMADGRSGKPTRYASSACRCRAYRNPTRMRTCVTCKKLQPRQAFPHFQAKRCSRCVVLMASHPCKNCGGPAGETANSKPRIYCEKPECVQARRVETMAHARKVQLQRMAQRRSKVCPSCGNRMLKTLENFGAYKRAPDGTVLKWDPYCRPCRKALNRDRHANDPQIRAKSNDRTKRWHDRIAERRREDPEFDR